MKRNRCLRSAAESLLPHKGIARETSDRNNGQILQIINTKIFKVINRFIVILCYAPIAYLILFYSFVLRAIIKLGRLPSYDNPDPKELGFDKHRAIVYLAFDVLFYALLAIVILSLAVRIAKKMNVKKVHWVILGLGLIAVVLHLLGDPFDAWFLD